MQAPTSHPWRVTALLLALLPGLVLAADSTEIEHKLASQHIDLLLESVPVQQAVYRILGQFELAVQVRWSSELEIEPGGISITVQGRPVGEILARVLEAKNLAYVVRNGEILILPARDRICLERDQAEQRFDALQIVVELVVTDPDRCRSQARINGTTVREGDQITPEVTVGLIQKDRVIFLHGGFLFEVLSEGRIPGGPPGAPPPLRRQRGDAETGDVDEIQLAYDDLDLHVTGTAVLENERFAVVNGQEVQVGSRVRGAVVQQIEEGYVIFEFMGRTFKEWSGQ